MKFAAILYLVMEHDFLARSLFYLFDNMANSIKKLLGIHGETRKYHKKTEKCNPI